MIRRKKRKKSLLPRVDVTKRLAPGALTKDNMRQFLAGLQRSGVTHITLIGHK